MNKMSQRKAKCGIRQQYDVMQYTPLECFLGMQSGSEWRSSKGSGIHMHTQYINAATPYIAHFGHMGCKILADDG